MMGKPKKGSVVYVGEFAHIVGKKWQDEELTALADEFLKWMEEDESRVWFRKFFTQKRIGKNTVKRFRDRHEYFEEIYGLVKDIQEDRLVERGLTGKGNQVFVIMTLKNVANWRSEPQEKEEEEDHVLISSWPSEEETAEAKELLKDQRIRDEMLSILRQEESEKHFHKYSNFDTGAQGPNTNNTK